MSTSCMLMRMQALGMPCQAQAHHDCLWSPALVTLACYRSHHANVVPEQEFAACCARYICARMRLRATPCMKVSIVTNPTGLGSAAYLHDCCQCQGHLTGHERVGAAVEALKRSQQPLIKRACAQRDVVRDVSPRIRRLSRRERTRQL